MDRRSRVFPEAEFAEQRDTGAVSSVLIVDDHPAFRRGARRLVESLGYVVAGEAATGRGAVAAVERLRPDVVLLDVHLPDIDGFEVARRVASRSTGPRVVMVSSREPSDFGDRLPGPGVETFLSKSDLSGATLAAALTGES
jgi:DNA-binding NarL/FixJ family response regulator